MTNRRRLLRFPDRAQPTNEQRQRRLHKLRDRLDREQKVLARLLSRLTRVFHSFEKTYRGITRLEREIHKLEEQ